MDLDNSGLVYNQLLRQIFLSLQMVYKTPQIMLQQNW